MERIEASKGHTPSGEPGQRQVRTRKESELAWGTHYLKSPDGGTSQDTECERGIDECAREEISMYQYSLNSSDAERCITTHPERRKGQHAYPYYYFHTHNALFHFSMCSIAAVNLSLHIPIHLRTYRVMACFTLSSKLSLWTATSMRVTTSSPSSLAVLSMRSVHWTCLCISGVQTLISA